ncbi:hypothetical protein M758_3G045000 [Ceratodon purpureus]|nr:hypothetical protein M758_3G045000 [Ceratodon purpureus]
MCDLLFVSCRSAMCQKDAGSMELNGVESNSLSCGSIDHWNGSLSLWRFASSLITNNMRNK